MYKDFYWNNDDTKHFMREDYLPGDVSLEDRVWEMAQVAGEHVEKWMPDFAERFFKHAAQGAYSFSTPTWCNFGNNRGLPISCNNSYIPDSIEGMYDKLAEVGVMTKHGAGTSFYLGDIRARGTPIRSGGVADGPVHYLQLFEAGLNVTSQGQVRRGNGAAYLDIDHPDFGEFLRIRDVGNPIQKLSIGACVSDDFMDTFRGDEKKEDLWVKLLAKRFGSGYPYIFFNDTANRDKPQWYKDKGYHIYSSNLCVGAGTQVLTSSGYEEISSLAGTQKEVWNGESWSLASFAKTGENKTLYRVTTADGSVVDCTSEHDWYVVDNYHSKPKKVKTKDLGVGARLEKFSLPVVEGASRMDRPYTNGFFSGDGCEFQGTNILYLYEEKKLLLPYMEGNFSQYESGARITLRGKGLTKFKVPNASFAVKDRLSWLAGYLDADGTVVTNDGCYQVQASSVVPSFLEEVRLMLQTLGVYSRITKVRGQGAYLLPANDGTGQSKKYDCQNLYRLTISSVNTQRLLELGLSCNRLLIEKKEHQREAAKFNVVLSVEELEGSHDTYCFNEPIRHKGMFNGVMTGQCSEISLPSKEDESFVCNLSSMNLARWDYWKDTDAVFLMTIFLDAVMEEYIEKTSGMRHMEAATRFAKNHRAIGIGTLGFHSLLQDKGATFGGLYSRMVNKQSHKLIKEQSYAASQQMAEWLGEPEVTKGYGMRNATTMAIAPTTSSSFILGQVSPSIEPMAANIYTKNLAKGSYVSKSAALERLLDKKKMDTKEVWEDITLNGGSVQHLKGLSEDEKAVFETFSEISQMDIIQLAADRQQYIDQSQSLNLSIPPDAKLWQVNHLITTAHKLGVKSLYYQRSTNAAKELARRDLLACTVCEA